MNTLVKEWFGGITFFRVTIENRRKKLLRDPVVIELIKGAYVACLNGETPEVYIKSMSR